MIRFKISLDWLKKNVGKKSSRGWDLDKVVPDGNLYRLDLLYYDIGKYLILENCPPHYDKWEMFYNHVACQNNLNEETVKMLLDSFKIPYQELENE